MNHDAMVDEVRKARAELLEEHGGDVHRLLCDMMKRQWESGHPVVSMPQRETQIQEATKPNVAEADETYGVKEQLT